MRQTIEAINFKEQFIRLNLFFIQRLSCELGFFDGRLFIANYQRDKNQYTIKCKLCNARITIYEQENKVNILSMCNLHKHQLKKHDPQFAKIFSFLQDHPLIDHIDSIKEDFFGLDNDKAEKVQNVFYQLFLPLEDILVKVQCQTGVEFTTWRNKAGQIYMILMISPDMKDMYRKYGTSLCFDTLPKIGQLRPSKNYRRYWVTQTFSGLDNNNRMVLFGVNMVVHNSLMYYKKTEVVYGLFENFFKTMNFERPPETIITNQSPAVLQAVTLINEEYKYGWSHLIGWPYKLKTIKAELKGLNYSKQQIKSIMFLYSKLLNQIEQNQVIDVINKLAVILKEKQMLFSLLKNADKYCFFSFPNRFCGFGLNMSKSDTYEKLAYNLMKRQNFYRRLSYILECERYLVRRSRKLQLAPKRKFQKIETEIKWMMDELQKCLGIFKNNQLLNNLCLQRRIFQKLTFNFNVQRTLSCEKILPDMYSIINSKNYICKVVFIRESNIWECTCMYNTKIGIPCPHLLHVIIKEKRITPEYFNPRWLKKGEFSGVLTPGISVLSRKKRRE